MFSQWCCNLDKKYEKGKEEGSKEKKEQWAELMEVKLNWDRGWWLVGAFPMSRTGGAWPPSKFGGGEFPLLGDLEQTLGKDPAVTRTFRERKRIVTILKTSHSVKGTILACQEVGARFLNDHGTTLCDSFEAKRGSVNAKRRGPQGFVGGVSRVHEQLLRGASPENGVVAAASKNLLNIAEPWRWLRTEVGRKVEKEEEEEEEMEDPPTCSGALCRGRARAPVVVEGEPRSDKAEEQVGEGSSRSTLAWGEADREPEDKQSCEKSEKEEKPRES